MVAAIRSVISSCTLKMSASSRSNRSAQRCAPFVASISCAVYDERGGPSLDASLEHVADFQLSFDLFPATGFPLYAKVELRAMTNKRTWDRR